MKKKPPRTPLNETDQILWESYKNTIMPLKESKKKPGLDLQKKVEITIQNHDPESIDLNPNLGSSPRESLLYQSPKKIRRVTKIQARLDLHGMSQVQAFKTVTSFIQRCFRKGDQDVLVITGKGLKSLNPQEVSEAPGVKTEGGVLRRNLPLWLEHPALRSYIHFYTFSHPFEGKTGACYVRLKKASK